MKVLFGGHVFLYLSASLQQSLPAALSLREIAEVDSALMRFVTELKTFAIRPAEVDSTLMLKGLEPQYESFSHQYSLPLSFASFCANAGFPLKSTPRL
jgi:hypothetical protein